MTDRPPWACEADETLWCERMHRVRSAYAELSAVLQATRVVLPILEPETEVWLIRCERKLERIRLQLAELGVTLAEGPASTGGKSLAGDES